MLINNLKIAWRHLLKDKWISLINFAGLVVGMTAVLFIWQYVAFEKGYDKLHEKGDRVYRVRTDRLKDGVPFMQFASGAACAGPVIANNFPEVEDYVKLYRSGDAIYYTQQEVTFEPENVYYAMPSFFDVFDFELVEGDRNSCLNEPWTACVSETTAKKLFGDENPIGKVIKRNNDAEYKITGITKDSPLNSHLKYDILLSYITFSDILIDGNSSETAPYWDGFLTYLLLKPNTDPLALEAKIPNVMRETYDQDAADNVVFYLQPFEDVHLYSNFLFETETPGDGNAVNFLLIIGSLVLLIAWFNYVNLATARSEMRAKEVGVRKVVGSGRGSLIRQFMTEAALMNVIAIVAAFSLAQVLSPWFVNLIEKPIPMSILSNMKLLGAILGVFLLGTFLTGLYPAFLLSSFKPSTVLKTGLSGKQAGGGNWMRRGLVVLQFMASVGLIAGTIIIFQQLNFMQNKKLGVHIDQTLVVKSPMIQDSLFNEKTVPFKNELRQLPAVKSVSASSSVPGQPFGWTAGVSKWGADPQDDGFGLHAVAADYNYGDAYDLEIVAGRLLSEEMRRDTNSVILNETGARVFEMESPEAALGLEINFWGDRVKVVGVVKDFHQESPKAVVEPMILRSMSQRYSPNYFSLKLNTEEVNQTIASVERIFTHHFPGQPVDFFFLDDHYNQQYNQDKLFGKIFTLFSGLAILVSCLGLFALIAFVAERRKKEIGIRKVLGASVPNIVGMLSKDFLGLVVVALIIATPLAFYFMNNWLENFQSRIDIQWWMFALAGVLAVGIAFLTVGFQSVKAALTNPVESLRSE